jgi:hypothetical protein
MPVSDLYLVQYLIQSSQQRDHSLDWFETEASEFCAELNGVHLNLFPAHSSDSVRLCLKISSGAHRTFIQEPRNIGYLSVRYQTENDRTLADALHMLARTVAAQCSRRRTEELRLRDSIREELYRRLLFGNGDCAHG